MPEETSSKSVPVYALKTPDNNIMLRFVSPDGTERTEEAAMLSFIYNLTGPRRVAPSLEPERTVYKGLKPWKKLAIPNFVVVMDNGWIEPKGAPVVAWDGKKSLQGQIPWGRPVVGIVSQQTVNGWDVAVDPIAMALADQQMALRQAAALEKTKTPKTPKPEVQPEPQSEQPLWVGTVSEVLKPEPPAPMTEIVVANGAGVEQDVIDFDYTGDMFSVRADGHFVGDDGFVVPMNFDEFYDRYPKYVLNWVKKRLNRFTVDEDVEDWTQDLLIHMKWLPQASKHRMPGANGREFGCADVVETFNPYQQYGASERRFRNYINFCLANKFNTVQSKRQKNPVCRPGNVAFGVALDETDPTINSDEFIHQNSQHLADRSDRVQKQHDDRLFTNEFKEYVRKEDVTVYPAFEALEACGPMGEAAEYMGVSEQEFARIRTRLKQLADAFVHNHQVPKQRKPYRKRATVGGQQ